MKTLFHLILFLMATIRLYAVGDPCYSAAPTTLKEALGYFNTWNEGMKPKDAYINYLLKRGCEDEDFKNAAKKSIANIAPFYETSTYSSNADKCMIPKVLCKTLTGKDDMKLHYGIILPHPDKTTITLLVMDSKMNIGSVILDKNYNVLRVWEKMDAVSKWCILDIEFKGDKLHMYLYSTDSPSYPPSDGWGIYTVDKVKGTTTDEWFNMNRKDPFRYFTKIPILPHLKMDDTEAAMLFFEQYGLAEGGYGIMKTASGINVLVICERRDDSNFSFKLQVLDAEGYKKGQELFVYYFGGIASSETLLTFNADVKFVGDMIYANIQGSTDGKLTDNTDFSWQINPEGIKELSRKEKEIVSDNASLLQRIPEVSLPLKIGVKKRESNDVVGAGYQLIIAKGISLTEEERTQILPKNGWGPYDHTDVVVHEGTFVRFKTSAGVNVVAAWESASLTELLHLQVVDEQGNALGEAVDIIVGGYAPNGNTGGYADFEILNTGEIKGKTVVWENDYNTGAPKPDSVQDLKYKITKGGILK